MTLYPKSLLKPWHCMLIYQRVSVICLGTIRSNLFAESKRINSSHAIVVVNMSILQRINIWTQIISTSCLVSAKEHIYLMSSNLSINYSTSASIEWHFRDSTLQTMHNWNTSNKHMTLATNLKYWWHSLMFVNHIGCVQGVYTPTTGSWL